MMNNKKAPTNNRGERENYMNNMQMQQIIEQMNSGGLNRMEVNETDGGKTIIKKNKRTGAISIEIKAGKTKPK